MATRGIREHSTVFVVGAQERCGVAFFVTGSELLTCAHVVAASLGFPPTAGAADCQGKIVRCVVVTQGDPLEFDTEVLVHCAALAPGRGSPEEQAYSDLAVLRVVEPNDLPINPVPLQLIEPQSGDVVWVSGVMHPTSGMLDTAGGKVSKRVEDARYLVTIDPGQDARPGYSGGPAERQADGAVVGLVATTPKGGGDAKIISASIARDALRGRYALVVADRKPGPGATNDEFFATLLLHKDRHDEEDTLSKAVDSCAGSEEPARRFLVAVLDSPPDSVPRVFVNRLATRRFAMKALWRGRLSWAADWAWPRLRFDGVRREADRQLTQTLEELPPSPLQAIVAPAAAQEEEAVALRVQCIRRFALVPIELALSSSSRGRWDVDLAQEVQQWMRAHKFLGHPVFCLLVLLHHETTSSWLGFRRSRRPAFDVALTALQGLSGPSVLGLGKLRPLRAELDLEEWIRMTGRIIRAQRHEPDIIKGKVLSEVYLNNETKDVSFKDWMGRLHDRWKQIFVEL